MVAKIDNQKFQAIKQSLKTLRPAKVADMFSVSERTVYRIRLAQSHLAYRQVIKAERWSDPLAYIDYRRQKQGQSFIDHTGSWSDRFRRFRQRMTNRAKRAK